MQMPPFKLERYFAEYEFNVDFVLCASDCESSAIQELLDFAHSFVEVIDHDVRLQRYTAWSPGLSAAGGKKWRRDSPVPGSKRFRP